MTVRSTNTFPLTRGNEGEVVTQYDMKAITDVGLLKMDFLGLKNLTVIHEAVQHIRKHTPDFEIEKISFDDWKTFELLNRGETMGVFQLGIRRHGRDLPQVCRSRRSTTSSTFSPLYRPGAMQFIDQMLDVKKGRTRAMYEHPLLEQVAGDTYGVMIYQEQVQNAAKVLAGYSLGGADLLRRAMGKKDPKEMEKQRAKFIEGARGDEQHQREARQPDLRQDRDVRRLRIQQIPLRLLRPHLLLDRLSEGEPPGRVHGRAPFQRNPQHRQDRRLRFRVPPHGPRDPAARPQRIATPLLAGNHS